MRRKYSETSWSYPGSWHLTKIDPEILSRYSLDTSFVYLKDHGRSSTLSVNPIIRDLCTRMCDVYLYSISFRVVFAGFGICWIIQRESSAMRINDSLKIANSFKIVPDVKTRKFSRAHFILSFSLFLSSAARRKDLICTSHAIWWHDQRYKSTAILRRLRLEIPVYLRQIYETNNF